MSFYEKIIKIITPVIKRAFRVTVVGENNIPADGKILVCSNHTSMFDPFVIMASVPRKVCFMAKKELFGIPIVGGVIRAMGAFPVNRRTADVAAIKTTVTNIQNGNAVGIFPQGTRCPRVDPAETEIKSGVGMIVCRSGCDVVPMFIKTKNNKVKLFGKTELVIGKPVKYSSFGFEEQGRKDYTAAAELIFSKICILGGYLRTVPGKTEERGK